MATQVRRRRGTTEQHASWHGAQGEFTYDEDLKTIRIHDGVTDGGFIVVTRNTTIAPGSAAKVTFNSLGLITGTSSLSSGDIPDLSSIYVAKNNTITAGTGCKISYDAKGLVTGSTSLTIDDIPTLTIAKTSGLQDALDGKMPKIPVNAIAATSGTIQLVDNAVNTLSVATTATLQVPTVTDHTVLHQFVVQLHKTSSTGNVTTTATHYFGGGTTAPIIQNAGNYNLYFEYDERGRYWVMGAITKSGD